MQRCRGGAELVDLLQMLQYGHNCEPCTQGVWYNGSKKLFVEICQTKIWVRCPKYMESSSGLSFQNDLGLLKIYLVMILFLV